VTVYAVFGVNPVIVDPETNEVRALPTRTPDAYTLTVWDEAFVTAEYETVIDVVDPDTALTVGALGVESCVAVAKVRVAAFEVDVAVVPFFVFVITTV